MYQGLYLGSAPPSTLSTISSQDQSLKIATSLGNPLAMSIGNAVLDIIFKKGFLKNVQKISKYFHKELHKLQSEYPKVVKEVRGTGLLVGLKISEDQVKFIKKLSDNKLLTVKASENVVRLLPPLTYK